MNRRSFFKRLGVITAALVVCPKIGLDRWVYADFIPGKEFRQAVKLRGRLSDKYFPDTAYKYGEQLLNEWFSEKIPPNFLNLRNVKFRGKSFNYGNTLGIYGSYQSPRRPIT